MANQKLYFGGLQIKMDVDLLFGAFPAIQEGQKISHAEVETVLKLQRKEARYRTVTTAWRRKLFHEQNIVLAADIGEGFKCLTPEERLEFTVDIARATARKSRKLVEHATTNPVERMSESNRRFAEICKLYALRVHSATTTTNKQLTQERKLCLAHSTFEERKKAMDAAQARKGTS